MQGYSIGGKTGTSEDGVNTGKYVASFIGIATIDNPELVILVTLYNPTGEGGHGGGGVAAPVASQILGEVLPYLELKKDKQVTEEEKVTVPDLRNKTVDEAKKELKELELELEIEKEYTSENIIIEQIPKPGIQLTKGAKVICEINEE